MSVAIVCSAASRCERLEIAAANSRSAGSHCDGLLRRRLAVNETARLRGCIGADQANGNKSRGPFAGRH
eukprot:2582802-Pleurochrysis_carterae.AAC.1